ncbi:MAG TPA: (Fe-S)-binding protein, partial [Pyrinomonadaceae bacterium]
RAVAARTLDLLEHELRTADYVIAPSGSCMSMVKTSYAELFSDEPETRACAESVGTRCYELSQFLVDVLGVEDVGAAFGGRVTYHDSCHLLRDLGVSAAPRKLIRAVDGAEFVEMQDAAACCGFGGTFSVRYPEISDAIAAEKAANIERSGADVVVACDSGCLMRTADTLSRRGSAVRCLHLAELLAPRGGR